MNFQHRPELRIEQRLTPQLVLNLKLLVLPIVDLQQIIESELEHNPALEAVEENEVSGDEESASGHETTGPVADLSQASALELGTPGADPAEEFDLAELLPQDGYEVSSFNSDGSEPEGLLGEVIADARVTYHDTLLPKILAEVDPEDTAIAEEIIDWLDDEGFLSLPEEKIAELTGIPLERLNRVLQVLRGIPPGGLGCPDMRSALLQQLRLRGYSERSLEYLLIAEHWDQVIQQNYRKLAVIFQTEIAAIEQAVANIAELEPRPGRQYTSVAPEYVTPDFAIEWREGRLVVVEQDSYIPRLRVARRFIEIIQNPRDYPAETVAFARKKVTDALMFLRAIESRRRLLRRLMEWIIRRQSEFFQGGVQFLRPAKIKEAATDLDVHPATVSRAISGKYVETPYGIFKLRDFFETGTGGIARSGIKEKIQSLIATEDKSFPLSDEELALKLQAEGIRISRRTVAKYRAEMGIPSSDERRRR